MKIVGTVPVPYIWLSRIWIRNKRGLIWEVGPGSGSTTGPDPQNCRSLWIFALLIFSSTIFLRYHIYLPLKSCINIFPTSWRMRARLDFLRPGMPRNISRAVEDVKVPGEGWVLPGSAFSCVVTRIFGVCSTDLRLDISTKGPKEVYRSSATILKKTSFGENMYFSIIYNFHV